MSQVDICLVNPGERSRQYQGLATELSAIESPVWTMLHAGYLRNRGRSVVVIDANAENLDASQVAERVRDINPRIVAIVVMGANPSSSTQCLPAAGAVAKALRMLDWPETKVVMVGGHVAALPERTLMEEAIDYAVAGEGPATLDALIQWHRAGCVASELTNVPGLVWWKDQRPTKNAAAPLVVEMDAEYGALPWDMVPVEKYRCHNWQQWSEPNKSRSPYAALYTSLGCYAQCSFCNIQSPFRDGEKALGMKRNSFRFFSPKLIGDQLEMLQKDHGVHFVKIADEMFVYNRKHVEAVCDEILSRRLDLNLWAYARVDTCKDDRVLDKIAAAGFKWLGFGIESANEGVRGGVDKGYGDSLIRGTLERVRARGINIGANYIFGLPGDTYETMEQTLNLALEVNGEYANFYCFQAIPGSPLYEQALRESWDLPKTWSGYAQLSKDSYPMPTKTLTSAEIVRFRDNAWKLYFNRGDYLSMIERRFGSKAVDEVKAMTAVKIERVKP